MTDAHKETITLINELIETCKDGEAGFRNLAENTKNDYLRSLFFSRSSDTSSAAAELQGIVRQLGGDPETSTSLAGDLHRRWVDLKAAVTGKNDAAILGEAERGEEIAKNKYAEALKSPYLAPEILTIVQKHHDGVLRNYEQIKILREKART